jgi:MFS family permease
VGALVGQERVLLPLIAEQDFGLASKSAILSFIASFGLVKALANLAAGHLSDRVGRRPLLLAGWLFGLPVSPLLIWAPSWGWVVFANMLLGVQQGLCWSATVIMKIDLVGPARRGLAMGLNEFAGYGAVSLAALGSGYLAAAAGVLRPDPLYPGVAIAGLGVLLSLAAKETREHAALEALGPGGREAKDDGSTAAQASGRSRSFAEVWWLTSWKDRALFSASQAGMVNNLNDGVVWGLVPIMLAAAGAPLKEVALVAAVYPGTWCVGQLFTGALSDVWGRKPLIAGGMGTQSLGIGLLAWGAGSAAWLAGSALLGLGTAMVYPTLIAAVSDVAHPDWRATAVGVYRLWRDGGYLVGALAAGVIADAAGLKGAVAAAGAVTLLSGLLVAIMMPETFRSNEGRR